MALVVLVSVGGACLFDCGGSSDPASASATEALAATTRPSPETVPTNGTTPPLEAANHFELSGGGLRISYYESAGVPVFTYEDAQQTRTFRGGEIEADATPAGTLVTVVTHLTIDSGSTTFSLLIPRVRVGEDSTPVQTQGITAYHRFSIVQSGDPGQLDQYTFTPLQGAGSHALAQLQTPAAGVREGVVPPLYAPNN